MLLKIGVLQNFAKLKGKHMWQSLFFNKVALLKKRLWHRCFSVNFAKFLTIPLNDKLLKFAIWRTFVNGPILSLNIERTEFLSLNFILHVKNSFLKQRYNSIKVQNTFTKTFHISYSLRKYILHINSLC